MIIESMSTFLKVFPSSQTRGEAQLIPSAVLVVEDLVVSVA